MAKLQEITTLGKFADVKTFFQSWGLFPSEEDCNADNSEEDWLNPEVISLGINRRCYEKLVEDADRYMHCSKYGNYFSRFCREQINATDDFFYLNVDTWEQLNQNWDQYLRSL